MPTSTTLPVRVDDRLPSILSILIPVLLAVAGLLLVGCEDEQRQRESAAAPGTPAPEQEETVLTEQAVEARQEIAEARDQEGAKIDEFVDADEKGALLHFPLQEDPVLAVHLAAQEAELMVRSCA